MAKLQGENLEFFVTHYEKYHAAYKTQIYFCFDSKQDGKSAFVMLKKVYAKECNYSAFGADYRDFYLGFTSKAVRNQVLADIDQAVANYQTAHGVDISGGGSGGGSGKKKGLGGTSVYIIVGAVVAVVLALVLNRKKKK